MSKPRQTLLRAVTIILITGLSSTSFSQTIIYRDPAISEMAAQVNRDSLQSYVRSMVAFGTRNTMSDQKSPVRGIGAARKWVLQRFQEFSRPSGGRMTAVIDTFTLPADGKRVDAPVVLGNVVATLKGTDPEDRRVFLISGHLDNRRSDVMDRTRDAPGANDDASGVAAVMECARIMSGHPFPATIVFIAVSGEEQGLLGADHMARKMKDGHIQLEAVLNNDIVGSNNSSETNINGNTRVRVFSEAFSTADTGKAAMIRQLGLENDGRSRQLARYVKETGERYVDNLDIMMVYRNDRFLRSGDHTPYVNRGYAGVRITELNENYFHQHQDVRKENGIQYGDLIEFMDFEYLRKNTAMNLVTLANLAKSPGVPREVRLDASRLTNYTDLSWSAPLSGKPKGYYVLIRETTSPVWQKKLYTPTLQMQLPFSKDNYFFGVQSVSPDGNESLPVIPADK